MTQLAEERRRFRSFEGGQPFTPSYDLRTARLISDDC
jgi:hypothetical protein